jgi:putative transcriptional regulator
MLKKYEIVNKIKTLRFFANDMSQQTLAELTGVSRQTINAIELGKYTPSLDLAYKIARVFEKTVDEVFEYKDL